jgi:hypothetical protein
MARKRHTAEEIVTKLRQVDALLPASSRLSSLNKSDNQVSENGPQRGYQ